MTMVEISISMYTCRFPYFWRLEIKGIVHKTLVNICIGRGVVPGGAGCAIAHPDSGRSVNPISTRGDRLCPPNYYWHPWIFNLPTALLSMCNSIKMNFDCILMTV